MSLSYVPLKPVKVVSPLLELSDTDAIAVIQGPAQLTYKSFTSSSISSSNIQFTTNPPSANTIVDRMQLVTVPFRLHLSGLVKTTDLAVVGPQSLVNQGFDALRKFPIQSAMETLQVTINGDSISQNMADVIHPLTGYNEDDEQRIGAYSMSPNMRDQSANYEDLWSTSRNPLGNFTDSQQGGSEPRGGFNGMKVGVAGSNVAVVPTLLGTPATCIVDCVCTEQLFLSPFFFGATKNDSRGFYNVTNLDTSLNFLANAGFRMWSHANHKFQLSGANYVSTVITSIAVEFANFSGGAFSFSENQPQMHFKYLTANMLSTAQLGPNIPQTYPYYDVNRYVTDLDTMPYSANGVVRHSQNIQLSTIPKKMYVFARPSNSVLQSRCDITDSYLSISGISIQFENQSAILSSANQKQLYMIDQANGGGMSYTQWSGADTYNTFFPPDAQSIGISGTAGPCCFNFGTDIPLNDPSLSPGVNGQYQIQVDVTLRNQNSKLTWDALKMSLYLVFVQEGSFVIPSAGQAQHSIGIISKQDVMTSQSEEGVSYRDAVRGGNFLDSLSSFGNNINDFLKSSKILSSAATLIPWAGPALSKVADNLGYGLINGGALMDRNDIVKTLTQSPNVIAKRSILTR